MAIREVSSWRSDSMPIQFDETSVKPKSPRALLPRALRTNSGMLFLESAEVSASSYSRGKHEDFRHENHQSIWPYSAIMYTRTCDGTFQTSIPLDCQQVVFEQSEEEETGLIGGILSASPEEYRVQGRWTRHKHEV